MKTREFETKIEVAGVALDALIQYECDPDDGWPVLEAVIAYVEKTRRYDEAGNWLESPQRERVDVMLTPILDEYQLHAFSSEIHDTLNADRNAARIKQMELRRLERAAA